MTQANFRTAAGGYPFTHLRVYRATTQEVCTTDRHDSTELLPTAAVTLVVCALLRVQDARPQHSITVELYSSTYSYSYRVWYYYNTYLVQQWV